MNTVVSIIPWQNNNEVFYWILPLCLQVSQSVWFLGLRYFFPGQDWWPGGTTQQHWCNQAVQNYQYPNNHWVMCIANKQIAMQRNVLPSKVIFIYSFGMFLDDKETIANCFMFGINESKGLMACRVDELVQIFKQKRKPKVNAHFKMPVYSTLSKRT
jgi:hypothetical protein